MEMTPTATAEEVEEDHSYSSDEFEFPTGRSVSSQPKRLDMTSRLRRRTISRSRGGAFGERKKKKRLYVNAFSSGIDLQGLLEEGVGALQQQEEHEERRDSSGGRQFCWHYQLMADVLHLSQSVAHEDAIASSSSSSSSSSSFPDPISSPSSSPKVTFDYSSQEVFIFEFGAVIAWGFSLKSRNLRRILSIIQRYPRKEQSTYVEDEMGYVISSDYGPEESKKVTISDDVITLSKYSSLTTRLSASYAIAQSIIVSAFEEVVANKIQEFKYIPRRLAEVGQIKLSPHRITSMIGDLFVLKHDLNLHSDILDTPDFFWDSEDATYSIYMNIGKYLKLDFRVEVINKRLDMLCDMLEVVQAQHQSQYVSKLDWMIIWLLLLEVVVQVFGGGLLMVINGEL